MKTYKNFLLLIAVFLLALTGCGGRAGNQTTTSSKVTSLWGNDATFQSLVDSGELNITEEFSDGAPKRILWCKPGTGYLNDNMLGTDVCYIMRYGLYPQAYPDKNDGILLLERSVSSDGNTTIGIELIAWINGTSFHNRSFDVEKKSVEFEGESCTKVQPFHSSGFPIFNGAFVTCPSGLKSPDKIEI